jgi:triacylglycerol lipase
MQTYAAEAARRGYVAVAIDYRLAPRHRFPAALDDCRDAVRWMKRQAPQWGLSPDRIGAWGYSAGGHLAALLGVCEEQLDEGVGCRVQAVVAGGAPCSFLTLPENNRMFAYFLGGSRAERPESYRLASPSWFASPDDPPVLFVHGATDFLVPRANAQELYTRLQSCGVRTRFHLVPECGHVGAFLAPSAREAGLAFLDDVLRRTAPEAAQPEAAQPEAAQPDNAHPAAVAPPADSEGCDPRRPSASAGSNQGT